MIVTLLLAQVRRVGAPLLLTPIFVACLVAGVGLLAAAFWSPVYTATLLTWLTAIFPLSVGIAAAVSLTGDPLVELHEASPASFRVTQVMRAAVVALGSSVGAVLMFVPLHQLSVWPRDLGWRSIANPLGAVVFLTAVGLLSAALSGSTSSATMSVIAAWIFLTMLWDPYVVPLGAQRGLPLAAAAGMSWVAWRRLGDAEKNIAQKASS